MYAFGYGLSYTTFEYTDLNVSGGDTVTVTFKVINTGKVTGADVPQLYLTEAPNEKRIRLLGFERVELKPGESRQVRLEPADLAYSHGLMAKQDSGRSRLERIASRSASLPAIWC